ncbi:PKD domain-containing protein, partial [bacterium]|nr:PKD domain-containing protein [bacterium]
NYRCVVSGTCSPSATSTAAKITVQAAPSISSQPSNSTICEDANTSFSVTASGTSISYQWQEDSGSGFSNVSNGGVYSGATTSSLSLTAAPKSMNGNDYRVIVSNTQCSAATSNTVTLTTNLKPSISANPTSMTKCVGGSVQFKVTASGTGISYQWQEDKGSGYNNLSNGSGYSGATTASLTISSLTSTMSGYTYRCVVSGTCSPAATSSAATLTVQTAPVISVDPSDATVCASGNSGFSVSATGTSLSYQWQENTGGGFANLSNSGVYSNTTTSAMSITGATTGMNGYTYRCVVDNSACTADTSTVAKFTVQSAPSISSNPSNKTICVGSNTSFSVSATGATLTYQWQEDQGSGFSNLSNAGVYGNTTTATLTLTAATAGMNGYKYRCVVSGTCSPSATSSSATLTVNQAPSISANPGNKTICSGGNTTFGVTASGASLSYRWQLDNGGGFSNISNGGSYSGATTATLSISSATTGMDGGKYRCVVSGSCTPSATSSQATLTVQSAPTFTTNPSSTNYCTGDDITFVTAATGSSLSYQWQEDQGSGFANLSNSATYTGVATNTLKITSAGAGLDGYKYRVVATNTGCGSTNSSTATITNSGSPSISTGPSSTTVCVNDDPTFSVSASGTALTYQWQVDAGSGYSNVSNTGVYSNATTATLSITNATASMNGYKYRCVVMSGTCPSATSSAATLTVNTAPSISSSPLSISPCDGDNVQFSVTASGSGLTYQWQENTGSGFANISNGGKYSGATSATLSIASINTGFDGNKYRVVIAGTCSPSVTSSDALLTVISSVTISSHPVSRTICSGNDTAFSVVASGGTISYRWQVDKGSGYADITASATYSGVATKRLVLTSATASMDGYKYRCHVSSTCGSDINSNVATLNVDVAPVVTANPGDLTKCASDAANFTVTAGVGTNLNYQWQEDKGSGFANLSNGVIYSGTTTANLGISSVSSAMNGYDYRCVVSNTGCGSTTSSSANLAVNVAPTVTSNSGNTTKCVAGNATFTIAASGAGLTYQWQENKGTGYTAVSNGGKYSGATSNSLSITNVTKTMDSYFYRCVVSGTCNPSATGTNDTLFVLSPPNITQDPTDSTICAGNNASFTIAATGDALTYQWQEDKGSGFTNMSDGGVYSNTTTTTLNITAATASMSGYQYRCVAGNSVCSDDISVQAVLTVQTAPSVTVDPSDVTACASSSTGFSVTATGSSLTYQWQEDQGSGYANLSNTGIYSGTTTASLGLSSVSTGMSGYTYRCVVANSTCTADISADGKLNVQQSPAVTANPTDSTICAGNNASFEITATGTSLTYQWQENKGSGFANLSNTGVYSGAATAKLSITAATSAMNGYTYRCVADNSSCTADISSSTTFTVQTAPSVSANPNDVTVCEGSNTSFSVTATGSSLSYQWQEDQGSGYADLSNTGIYSGATSATLSLSNSTIGMSGYTYRCVVSNSTCSPDMSNAAKLTVQKAPNITADPTDSTICGGNNATFSITATGTGLTYQWQENKGSGYANLSNGAVYGGTTTTSLSITAAATTMNGYKYRCVVGNSTCTGDLSGEATLTVQTAPSVNTNPSDVTICEKSNTSFTIAASGSALSYQWQVNTGSGFTNISNGTTYAGATTNGLSVSNAGTTMNGYTYRCLVSNSTCSGATSGSAKLSVQTSPQVTSNPSDSTICEGNNSAFSITATGTALTYQWQVNAGAGYVNLSNGSTYSGVTTASLSISAATATMNGYKYRCLADNSQCSPDISGEATLTVQVKPSISTQPGNTTVCDASGASFTVAAGGSSLSYQWQENKGSGFANISNTGIYSGAQTSSLSLSAVSTTMNGYSYRCIVDNATCNAATSNSATLSVKALPAISSNPGSVTVCVNDDPTFSVTASGAGITYQWQLDAGSGFANISNNSVYSGATTASLSITNVTSGMDGNKYRVIVSGDCTPAKTSTTATLTVQTPPSVTTNPVSASICSSTDTSFNVVATGSALTYQWQVDAGSGYTNIANGGVYSNTTTATLKLSSVPASYDGNKYRCVVDNSSCNAATSGSATLSILAQPKATSNPSASTICEGDNTSFAASGTGAGVNYQWQENAGSGYADISNSSIFGGATTNTLSITGGTVGMNSHLYRCVVKGTCSPADTTKAAQLTVDATPTVTSDPTDVSKCENSDVTFTVGATGTSISYQWQVDDGTGFADVSNTGKYSGATTSTLKITDIVPAIDSFYYRCVISGPHCPDAISNAAMLDVLWKSTSPTPIASDSSFCEGLGTALSASGGIAGDGSSMEWYTGPNGTGIHFGTGGGPFYVYPTDTTTFYVRREGTCNTTTDATITINVQPKPTADFSVFDNCEGQATLLFDSSTVVQDSITKYFWNFGDGGSSNKRNDIYIYSKSGTYSVSLIVETQNGCRDTVTKSTEIYHQPKADFSVGSVCLGSISEFKNKSKIQGSATLNYDWNFGDGSGTSTNANPEYTYLSSGGYTIQLKVTSSQGCSDSVSYSTNIFMLPTAGFTFQNACLGDSVWFTNTSKISTGSLTHEWSFGDGNTSTDKSPFNIYSKSGGYNVQLISTSNQGCKDTIVQKVNTYALPSPNFTAVSACEGELVSFTDKSSSPTGSKLSYDWNFGNGATSTSRNPQTRFNSSGNFSVRLLVTSAEGCSDSLVKSVAVYGNPQINFSSSKVCDGFATTFINSSKSTDGSSLSYQWKFGDGDTSLRKAPAHVYSASGTYTVVLVVKSGNNCIDSGSAPVTVWPNPTVSYRVNNVCLVDSATFINQSSVSAGTFKSLWKFGDGTTGTRSNPRHKYANAGSFSTKLIVTSDKGCEDSVSQALVIYAMPQPDFTYNNQCDGDEVSFVNKTVVTTGTQYIWAFGDGFGSTTETPVHTYLKPGTYNITLTATTANGCKETQGPKSVTIYPRVDMTFNANNVCDNDTVHFSNNSFLSGGTATYTWKFGDSKTMTGYTASHLYDTFGVYNVTLIGTTGLGCIDSVSKQVEVYPQPIAKYQVQSNCVGTLTEFKNKTIVPKSATVNYYWDFADGFTAATRAIKHQYEKFGKYTTQLMVVTNNGCTDSASRTHNVWPTPVADFKMFGSTTAEVSEICIYETANFADISTIASGKLVNWMWNYGDASSQSGLKNVQHNYLQAGVYQIEMQVESDSGCVSTATDKLEILPKPDVKFTFNDTCESFGVQFRNQSTVDKGQLSFVWDFGDNEKSTLREPLHAYAFAGRYDVSVIGISTTGCTDTAGPSQIVIHEIPDATITSSIGRFQFCEGDSVTLSVVDSNGYTYNWSNGEQNATVVANKGGVYEVTITSGFGCVGKGKELVTIWTRPTADAGSDVVISKGYSTELNGSGGTYYVWSPGSTLSDSLLQNPIATPPQDQLYTLVVEDDNGCKDTADVNVFVKEDYLLEPARIFTPNGDGVNDVWIIKNIETYPDCEVTVINRWQQIVYHSTGYKNNWGGTAKSDLPTGAYNYVIKCANGRVYTGTVNIVR